MYSQFLKDLKNVIFNIKFSVFFYSLKLEIQDPRTLRQTKQPKHVFYPTLKLSAHSNMLFI